MKEKKKKILNVRKSLIAGALVLTTALAGLGIHGFVNKQTEDPTQSSEPSSSQTIIDNNHSHKPELPGEIVIDPEVTDPVIEVPEVIEPIIKEPGETEKPISTPGIGENNNNGTQTSNPGTVITDPTKPTETDPIITIPEHTHTLGEWVAINDIIEGSYCPDDGVLVKVRMHNYTITGKEVITNNNGTHNIYITGECTNCGHSKTRIIENQDCNYENLTWDSVFEYETCEDCNYINTVGKHAFGEGKIEGNQILYSCENNGCGYTYTKPYNPNHNNNNGGDSNIDRPTHTHYYGEWISLNDELEANYCPEDGKLMGTRAHKYIQTDNKAISNNDGTHILVKEETCTNCNHKKTTTNSVSCEFGPEVLVGNQYVSTCETCGYEKTRPYTPPEHNHNWSEWKVTKPATCTVDGEETRTCTVDGCTVKVETRVIPALGHNMGAYIETKAPTCTEKGLETSNCSRCGYVTTREIPALGHKYGEWIVSEDWHVVTKEDGTQVEQRTLEQTCETCGDKKTKTEERAYTPEHTHNWSEWKVTKPATCTEDGEETRTCSVDGCTIKVETRVIPASGHKYGEWIVSEDWHVVTKEDGTQVEQRTLEQTCETCGDKKTKTEERAYTPEHVHNWSEWQITKPATCTEDGEETRTCSVDGCTVKVETRVIPALNHSYEESTSLVSNGDGTHDLIETKTCGACGDVQTETISSGVSCTYNNIVEVTNDDGVVIQEIHSCDCGHSYTVDIDPQPDHTVHTPDSNGQYKRSGTDCCYETYYICGECGVEYGNTKVGHVEGAPDEAGVIQCEQCGMVLRVEEPELPELPELPALPVIDEEEVLEEIINNQEESLTDASNNADQKLEDLINSEADDETIDATLEEIIVEQEQAIADANASADQQLNETIANIENAKVEEIIASQDSTVAEARKNAEARLEEVLASDADPATKDEEVDRIIEETDKVIGLATAKADAELAALIGAIPSANAARLLTK